MQHRCNLLMLIESAMSHLRLGLVDYRCHSQTTKHVNEDEGEGEFQIYDLVSQW